MIKEILKYYNNFDKLTSKILKYGLGFCLALCILSTFILLLYKIYFTYPTFYYIGFTLFKLSLIFAIEFIICGFIADGIKNGLI